MSRSYEEYSCGLQRGEFVELAHCESVTKRATLSSFYRLNCTIDHIKFN